MYLFLNTPFLSVGHKKNPDKIIGAYDTKVATT